MAAVGGGCRCCGGGWGGRGDGAAGAVGGPPLTLLAGGSGWARPSPAGWRQFVDRRSPPCWPPLPAACAAEGLALPFRAVAMVAEHGRTRLDFTVKVKSSFPAKLWAGGAAA